MSTSRRSGRRRHSRHARQSSTSSRQSSTSSRQSSTSSRERSATVGFSSAQHEQVTPARPPCGSPYNHGCSPRWHRRSPLAASEPRPVLHSTPEGPTHRRRLRSALHLSLAARQDPHALEAHAHLRVFTQPDDARPHGAVTAGPATRRSVRGFEGVGANRSQSHAGSLPPRGSPSTARTISPVAARRRRSNARSAWARNPRPRLSLAQTILTCLNGLDVPRVRTGDKDTSYTCTDTDSSRVAGRYRSPAARPRKPEAPCNGCPAPDRCRSC